MYQKHGIVGLFLLLVAILIVKPRVFYNLYNHILGRVLLIGVIIFFTTFNVTLGLFAALCLIIASNMFFIEGLSNLNEGDPMIKPGTTIGDDNEVSSSSDAKLTVTTKAKAKAKEKGDGSKISELQEQAEAQGVDRQTIHETIQAKSSKTIPTNPASFASEDVSPSETTSSVDGFHNKYKYAKF
jgi:hypothetical protein